MRRIYLFSSSFLPLPEDHSQRDTCISPSQNLAIHHPLSLKPVSISGEGGGGDIKSTMVDREAYRAQWNGIFRGIASHPFAEERSVDWLPTGLWKERSWSLLAIFKPLSLSNPPNSTRTWLVYLLGKSRRRRKARIYSSSSFPTILFLFLFNSIEYYIIYRNYKRYNIFRNWK